MGMLRSLWEENLNYYVPYLNFVYVCTSVYSLKILNQQSILIFLPRTCAYLPKMKLVLYGYNEMRYLKKW